MKYTHERLGNNIRALRKKRRMTIKELADSAVIAESYLGLVERGKRGIRTEKLCQICEVLNASLDDVVYGSLSAGSGFSARETGDEADETRAQIDILLDKSSKNELLLTLKLLRELRHYTETSVEEGRRENCGNSKKKNNRGYNSDEIIY